MSKRTLIQQVKLLTAIVISHERCRNLKGLPDANRVVLTQKGSLGGSKTLACGVF